jgi:hypothetical protein
MTPNHMFSIVIPTIGRHNFITNAIKSVSWQTFRDFELIISDNSKEGINLSVIQQVCPDITLQILRPEKPLPMAEHWEFATRGILGKYLIVLCDSRVILPDTLSILNNVISTSNHKIDVFCWKDDAVFWPETGKLTGFESYANNNWEILKSLDIAASYAKFMANTSVLPHAWNSCCSRTIAETIRKQHGSLFMPVSPDYTSAFLLLAYTEAIMYLDFPLSLHPARRIKDSTGGQSMLLGLKNTELRLYDYLKYSPIKIDSIINTIISDLIMVKKLIGNKWDNVNIDYCNLLSAIYSELISKERQGSFAANKKSFDLVLSEIDNLSFDKQRMLQLNNSKLNYRRRSFVGMTRRLLFQIIGYQLTKTIEWKIRKIFMNKCEKHKYANILEAGISLNKIYLQTK